MGASTGRSCRSFGNTSAESWPPSVSTSTRTALRTLSSRHPQVPCTRISDRGPLPFRDGAFDSISCLEVLEHVSAAQDIKELLREFRRLLAPNGLLVVSTPGRHLFSVFDLGNVKFLGPEAASNVRGGPQGEAVFQERYVSNRFGLVGDIWSTPAGINTSLARGARRDVGRGRVRGREDRWHRLVRFTADVARHCPACETGEGGRQPAPAEERAAYDRANLFLSVRGGGPGPAATKAIPTAATPTVGPPRRRRRHRSRAAARS